MLKNSWQSLRKWYIDLLEILTEFVKNCLLSLPKAILGIAGFFVFIIVAFKIGWWALPIYIGFLFLGFWIYLKFFSDRNKLSED